MVTTHINTKVCIIGAGPAGAATSIFLSKLNVEHIIVDAANFPRTKVCGDGLDCIAVRMLNHIDKNIVTNELPAHPHFLPSWGIRSIKPSGKHIDFSLKPTTNLPTQESPFFVAERLHFDAFLISKFNPNFAEFKPQTTVQKLVKEGNGWRIFASNEKGSIEITCNIMVGADGDHSVVLKHLGDRKIDRQHYAGAVRQYFTNVQGLHPHNLLEFYFPKNIPMSYFWIFPMANGKCNVGFGVLSSIAAQYKINVKQAFENIIKKDDAVASRFANAKAVAHAEGWGLPLASRKRKIVGDGWLLVGDAASMITPINGEGIGNSMKTGYIAAHFIKKAVENNSYTEKDFANYSTSIFKTLAGEIKSHNFYLQYPSLSNWVINNLVQNNFVHQYCMKKVMQNWVHTAYNKSIEISY